MIVTETWMYVISSTKDRLMEEQNLFYISLKKMLLILSYDSYFYYEKKHACDFL